MVAGFFRLKDRKDPRRAGFAVDPLAGPCPEARQGNYASFHLLGQVP